MTAPIDSVTACTIVARNYLPAARVLARSYLANHPGHEFVIAVIDAPRDEDVTEEGYRIVGPAAFGIDELTFLRMATAYSVTELATSVKPYLLRALRKRSGVAIYLDPDIEVFGPMPELAPLAREHGIVLTPHFLAPLPRDGKEPDEAVIMGTGIFNLGFVAVGEGSGPFLDFWAERLKHDAIVAPEQQLFTDQRWVDMVPALFGHYVLTDPGFNVAYWNLHERDIERAADGTVTAGGHRLRFFHFSGYRPESGWLLTFHCARKPRVLLSDNEELRALCDQYGAKLKASGYAESLEAIPYGFANCGDGTPLTGNCRRIFRDGWINAEQAEARGIKHPEPIPPHAYESDGGAALRTWIASPSDQAQAAAGLNRLAMRIWASRTDLRIAYPHPTGDNAEDFRTWCERSGVPEGLLPEWARPERPSEPGEPSEEFGVNLLGYLTAELGLGEMGRIVHDAIAGAGVPIASVLEERSLSNRTGMARPVTVGEPKYGVSVLAVNADQTRHIIGNHPEVGYQRYRIGLWAWELEDFPRWQHEAFDMVDEVWTVSDFCRDAIAEHATVPVKTIPVPVRDPGESTARLREPGEPIRFLFAFDFNSVGERKNPWGVVTAFQRAFADRGDVRLVLKTINGKLHPQNAERLRAAVVGDDRIELIERYLAADELHKLYDDANCYVSLHRSEGFGLTVAEAMARAMPVISTNYSSTTEFLDERTGWPVPFAMVVVGKNNHPYHPGAIWAEPDLDAAAAAMRQVADEPEEAARRGVAAREHILRTRSMAAAAEWMGEQLRQAHERWLASRIVEDGPAPEHPLLPMYTAKESLNWRADAGSAARSPIAPAVRKAVLRAIDHYDVHQRQVMGALFDGTQETISRLLGRVEALEARADEARELSASAHDTLDRATRAGSRQNERIAAQQVALDELRDHVRRNEDNVRSDVEVVSRRTSGELSVLAGEVRDAIEESSANTHAMFAERDARVDSDEHSLQSAIRDVRAVHEAQVLRHAPVPTGHDVVVCDAGALLMPVDDVVLPWIRHHRSWEVSEAELMAELAQRRHGTFLDVGAHVGYHTLRLLRSAAYPPRVVAVEADPVNADCLRRNLSVNVPDAVAAQVTVHAVAAWNTEGELRLTRAEAGNSGDNRANEDGPGAPVVAVRLDSVPEVTEQPVTLVKTDLQGRDHRALSGLADVLAQDRPDVVCEFDPAAITELGDDPAEVLAWYRKLGYDLVPVGVDGPGGQRTDAELLAEADSSDKGFTTLWLRPG